MANYPIKGAYCFWGVAGLAEKSGKKGRPRERQEPVEEVRAAGPPIHPLNVLAFLVPAVPGVWYGLARENVPAPVAGVVVGLLLAMSFRVASQWHRLAVLRLGHFRGMRGPGLVWVIPFVDSVPYAVDVRIIPYNVPPQKTLTNDNVPVTVDAIVYYQVADPTAAVLNVQDYERATQWGAAAVLRDLIGKSTLDQLLSEREQLARSIRANLDELTGKWGVRVPNVEIRDVLIAEQLEDAIAREPAAEREKRARLRLAEAERLAAGIIVEAARIYEEDPVALQLRSMNMLYEMAMEGKGTIIFVPTQNVSAMPTPVGVYGVIDRLEATRRQTEARGPEPDASEGAGHPPSDGQ